jgi:hypothetical protein
LFILLLTPSADRFFVEREVPRPIEEVVSASVSFGGRLPVC